MSLLGFYCINSRSFTSSSCWQHYYFSTSSELKVAKFTKSFFKIFYNTSERTSKASEVPAQNIFYQFMHIFLSNTVNQQIKISQGFIAYILRSEVQTDFSVKGRIFYNFLLGNLQAALRVQIFIAQLPKSYDIQQHVQSKFLSTCFTSWLLM